MSKQCEKCGNFCIKYGHTKRLVKTKYGERSWITVQRWRCKSCGGVYRDLPNDILPYKHYEREMIEGVQEGLIDSSVKGFEDYPCEMTMRRWRRIYKG